jgi:siderophore synthetase component
MVAGLPDELGIQVVQTAVAVLVYALVVNAFYQIIRKRRMFVPKEDVAAEQEIEAAIDEAKAGAKEVEELADDINDQPEIATAIAVTAQATDDAITVAAREIQKHSFTTSRWWPELRARVLSPLWDCYSSSCCRPT